MATTSNRRGTHARKLTMVLRKEARNAKNVASKNLRKLGANASEFYEQGREKSHQVERGMVQLVRHRPFRFALIAASVGLVLGGFWLRHFRKARDGKRIDA